MILIHEVARCSGYHGYLKVYWPEISMRGGEIVNPLFVGIDVSGRSNVAYLDETRRQ